MNERAIGDSRGSSEPLSSGLSPEQLFVISSVEDTHGRSIDGRPMAVALTAGLTPPGGDRPFVNGSGAPGDGLPGGPGSTGPARPDGQPLLRPLSERPGETSPARSGRVGPAVMPFELAAVMCGYEPTSPAEAAEARADWRVWDLVGSQP